MCGLMILCWVSCIRATWMLFSLKILANCSFLPLLKLIPSMFNCRMLSDVDFGCFFFFLLLQLLRGDFLEEAFKVVSVADLSSKPAWQGTDWRRPWLPRRRLSSYEFLFLDIAWVLGVLPLFWDPVLANAYIVIPIFLPRPGTTFIQESCDVVKSQAWQAFSGLCATLVRLGLDLPRWPEAFNSFQSLDHPLAESSSDRVTSRRDYSSSYRLHHLDHTNPICSHH